MDRIRRLLAAVDDFQQRHRWLAFPFAVVKKFGDDQAGRHAALLAYYGFFSLFPLLLVAVTVIGFILQGRSDLADPDRRIDRGPVPDRRPGHHQDGRGQPPARQRPGPGGRGGLRPLGRAGGG